MNYKHFFTLIVLSAGAFQLAACSTNAATGRTQFTGLMSPEQEVSVGAEEHQKVIAEFGEVKNPQLKTYVSQVGNRVTQNTERPDVDYKFYVLDSPVVNAFALPGGYIYVTRGLLSVSNSEAELAAVLGHEAGHITGRHSAERYSRGVVTSLGVGILSAAIDKTGVSQALGLGSQLYMSSYSRDQEREADTLGIRYLDQSNYDAGAMAGFLTNLQNWSAFEDQVNGRQGSAISSYFSTHPATEERVAKTRAEAAQVADAGVQNRNQFLDKINGMTYGDSSSHGFVRGQTFIHPEMGFQFTAPNGFRIINQPSQVIAASQGGAVMVFDMVTRASGQDALTYLRQGWLKNETVSSAQSITISGMPAATASFNGNINNQPMEIRLIAIEFAPNKFARFQIGIPRNTPAQTVEELKRASYSFDRVNTNDPAYRPHRLQVITAGAGDTVNSLATRFPYSQYNVERFRVLNGMNPGEQVRAGERYKIVVNG